MDSLKISLSAITEHGVPFDAAVTVAALRPEGADPLPMAQVRLTGTATLVSDQVLVQGRLQGVYVHPCDRCLEEARRPLNLDVLWCFSEIAPAPRAAVDGEIEVLPDEPDLPRPIVGNEVDLAAAVWEELVLAAPLKYVCNDACRGLCPHCGANLNRGACACGCVEKDTNGERKAFAKLADLFRDTMERPTED